MDIFTLGVTPFSKPVEFWVVAGTSKLYYNRDTNQWIVDGKPTCMEPTGLLGVQRIPSYFVGDGRTDHPEKRAVILQQGLLVLEGNLYSELNLNDLLNTLVLDTPEPVIKARCD